MESENSDQKKANFTDLALTLFRRKHGRSEQNQKVQALTPHVPAVVTFADHSKPLPWSTKYHSVLMFADISGFTSLCETYSAMEKSGIDELTSTLNGYMGAIVDGILTSDGDVLKYAGDAILAMWRVNVESELSAALDRVIQCCLDIQGRCGEWDTSVGVKLTVKMGIAAGDMTMTFLGNDEFRHYVELGRVVSDVNRAESFCKSGYVVLSPYAWMQCNFAGYETETMEDGEHIRVLGVIKTETVVTKTSNPEVVKTRERRLSLTGGTQRFLQAPPRRMSLATSTPSKGDIATDVLSHDTEDNRCLKSTDSMAETSARKMGFSKQTMSGVMKLRNVVKTVTAMKLEETLRLYVLSPVLKKLDDNQPLEYLSEMRQVSIVFINLVLADGEDNTQLLQHIFEIVFSNIKLVHGCLNKIFLFDKGCTFLVIFGLPGFKHERDCAHALQNSVKMKTILDQQPGIEHVSIGVTTGITFCGVIGHTRRHEYSVIGRKVNMAARLMMHYPDKVTCDDETFQSCRLPPENFVVLVTKRMKGLRNIGIIREFSLPDEQDKTGSELANSIPYFEYPLLGREAEKELFLRELNHLVEDTKRRHIVFVGAAGIGKTRLLDTLCNLSVQENVRVISFSLNLQNSNSHYFLVRHLLKMMLTSCGYSQEVEKEPVIMETMRLCGMDQHIKAMTELLSTKLIPSSHMNPESREMRQQVFEFLANMCLDNLGPTTFIIDDMHFCDKESWESVLTLSDHSHCLLVLSFRSYAIEQPPCPAAQKMFEEKKSVIRDIFSLDLSLLSALACQCLDVVNIPKELDKLLRERSQGVPSWVEQLLHDMFEKRQILIRYTDLVQNSFRECVVAPRLHLITKSANVWRTAERRRPSVSLNFADDLSPHMDSQDHMLADLGFLVPDTPKIKDKKEQRVCIMAPGICAQDIGVPDSMKDLVIARIDSMRATEQLIVKCAAVLDPPFTRQMLEEVLPQASTFKVSTSLKRLFENGTFECSNASNTVMTSFGRTEARISDRGECLCPREDAAKEEDILCNQLKYRHALLKDTAQEMLMGKQKQHLHQKAAEFIEQRVKDIRSYVPFQLFVRIRPEPAKKKKSESSDHNTRSANEETSERFRTILKSGEMYPHLLLILEGAVIDNRRNSRLEQLLPEYERIAFHYAAADDALSLIDTQIEAALVAILLKKHEEALNWLKEAKATFRKLQNCTALPVEVITNLKVIQAGVERLQGKALHQSGQFMEAWERFTAAAVLLDLTEPSSKSNTRFQMFKLRLSTFPQFIYFTKGGAVRQLREASRKRVELGHLLGDLCRLHKDKGHKDLLILDAWRHAANIIGKNVHIHQVLESYIHLIAACRTRGWWDRAHRLEIELYATCCARSHELLFDDVKALAATLGESSLLSLNDGNIPRAMDRGQVAAILVGHMSHTRLSVRIYPILAFAYLAADRCQECLELLDKLKDIYADLEGWGVDTWSTIIALELMLSPGIPTQTFLMCLMKATTALKSYDAVIDGNIARYYIGMCVALWYCRKGQWQEGQSWFDYWESYDLGEPNYITVGAWCKKVECMLLSMCRTIENGATRTLERIKTSLDKEIPRLKKILKVIPGWKPRFYHLRAYFYLLQGKLTNTRADLVKCGQLCQKQDSVLQFRLLEHSWREWYRQITTNNSLNTDWIDQQDAHLLDWRLRVSRGEQVLYALPLPQERVVRRGRWWRSNKVTPL